MIGCSFGFSMNRLGNIEFLAGRTLDRVISMPDSWHRIWYVSASPCVNAGPDRLLQTRGLASSSSLLGRNNMPTSHPPFAFLSLGRTSEGHEHSRPGVSSREMLHSILNEALQIIDEDEDLNGGHTFEARSMRPSSSSAPSQ